MDRHEEVVCCGVDRHPRGVSAGNLSCTNHPSLELEIVVLSIPFPSWTDLSMHIPTAKTARQHSNYVGRLPTCTSITDESLAWKHTQSQSTRTLRAVLRHFLLTRSVSMCLAIRRLPQANATTPGPCWCHCGATQTLHLPEVSPATGSPYPWRASIRSGMPHAIYSDGRCPWFSSSMED